MSDDEMKTPFHPKEDDPTPLGDTDQLSDAEQQPRPEPPEDQPPALG